VARERAATDDRGMTQNQKVAIITGASRGIGAGLVAAYRKLGYAVVATSRSVDSTDPEVLAVPGDLSRPGTGADLGARRGSRARCCPWHRSEEPSTLRLYSAPPS
jgi:NAD(P)-dependent dehydrogenase (short-subunit alcohol dehydrogenase family)